ncbi:MAG: chromate transporter [Proteobacteria bacterium]|nr:chromate transporter [Pseudomonadota bacterium]
MIGVLAALLVIFAELSLIAFGGGNSALPEMRRHIVDVHHWLTNQQFSALFALAQAAPGPNLMIVPLIGWHVAGLGGLVVSSIGMFGPSSVITCLVLHGWERLRDRPVRGIIQLGLAPVTAGLVAASALVIAETSAHSWLLAAIAVTAAGATLWTGLHPLAVLAAGALIGATGLGQP